jgi:hypothetical protein
MGMKHERDAECGTAARLFNDCPKPAVFDRNE